MDELIRHVVDQAAIGGAPGITAPQIEQHVRAFVDEQHEKQRRQQGSGDADSASGDNGLPKQVIDHAFLGFIWKRLARLPHIHVGRHLPASAVQPSQQSAVPTEEEQQRGEEQGEAPSDKAKGKAKKKDKIPKTEKNLCNLVTDSVDVDKDAKALPLSELLSRFGDELRFVVDEDTRKQLLAGSAHAALSPTAWTLYQLIVGYRQDGVSIPELVVLTGLDTKAAFYQLTKILGARGLVVLVKQNINKQLANVAIARRFCHLNSAWIELQRMGSELKKLKGGGGGGGARGDDAEQGDAEEDDARGDDDDGPQDAADGAQAVHDAASTSTLNTDDKGLPYYSSPIPSQVAPEAVIRVRLLRMLHHSPNHITPLTNMWGRIGLTYARRKSLPQYINSMEDEGLVERVKVLPDADSRMLQCLRLTDRGLAALEAAATQGPGSGSLDEKREARLRSMLSLTRPGLFCGEVVWERQVAEYAANTGMQGFTLDDVARDFHFAPNGKRSVESTLLALKGPVSTPAYVDLELLSELEQSGRMRSYRYLTRLGYIHRGLANPDLGLTNEALDAIPKDTEALRQFCTIEGDQTWKDPREIRQRLNDFELLNRHKNLPKAGDEAGKKRKDAADFVNPIDPATGRRKLGRPRKYPETDEGSKKAKNRGKNKGKIGRPRKNPEAEDGDGKGKRKRDGSGAHDVAPDAEQTQTDGVDEDGQGTSVDTPGPKAKRSRAQKAVGVDNEDGPVQGETGTAEATDTNAPTETATPTIRHKRGRCRKEGVVEDAPAGPGETEEMQQPKRKRGRPRKHLISEDTMRDDANEAQASPTAVAVGPSAAAAAGPSTLATAAPVEAEPAPEPLPDPEESPSKLSMRKSSRQRSKTAKALELEAARSPRGSDALARNQAHDAEDASSGAAGGAVVTGATPKGPKATSAVAASSPSSLGTGLTPDIDSKLRKAPAGVTAPTPSSHIAIDTPSTPVSQPQSPTANPATPRPSAQATPAAERSAYVERYLAMAKRSDKDKKPATPSQPRLNTLTRRRQVRFTQFMQERKVIDEAEVPREFQNYIAEHLGEAAAQEMSMRDVRTRRSIIDSLIADGIVKSTTVMQLPVLNKQKRFGPRRQHLILFVPDIEQHHLQDFCQRVQVGEEGNAWKRRDAAAPRKSKTDLGNVDIGIKEGAFRKKKRDRRRAPRGIARFLEDENLEKLSLDELISDEARAAVLSRVPALRQLMGVPKGEARRLQLLHEELVERALAATGDKHGTVDVVDAIFNMPWSKYVCIAPPAKSGMALVEAWEGGTNHDRAVKDLKGSVLRALGISQGHLPLKIQNHLRSLAWLGLLSVEDATSDYSRYVVSLEMEGVKQLGFNTQATPNLVTEPTRLSNLDDVRTYWTSLRQYSLGLDAMEEGSLDTKALREKEARVHLYNLLRDKREWRTAAKIIITVGQSALIRRIVDVSEGGRKLDDMDVARRLVHVSALPPGVVVNYLQAHLYVNLAEDHALLKIKSESEPPSEETQEVTAVRGRIAGKAQQAQTERGQKWDRLTSELFSYYNLGQEQREGIRTALKPFKKRYLRNPDIMPDLELERFIATAIVKMTQPLKIKSLKRTDRAPVGKKAKEKGEAAFEGRRKRVTTHRIEWTKEREELLRDACVILRARDKERKRNRKNWSALSQLFHNAPVAASHFLVLEAKLGEKPYLEQLEKEWCEVWKKYRGTRWLRDDSWLSPTSFKLQEHVDFLRARIDKGKVLDTVEKAGVDPLPLDIELAKDTWVYEKPAPIDSARTWDVIFASEIEASAVTKHQVLHENSFAIAWKPRNVAPIVEDVAQGGGSATERSKDGQRIDEAVVKMVLASSQDTLKNASETIQRFVELNGQEAVGDAVKRLERAGAVNTPSEEARRNPGNNVFYNERAKACLVESLPIRHDLVEAIEEHKEELESGKLGDSLVVDPNGGEVEAAALLELICEGKIDVDPHLEGIAPLRDELFLNVKKINDDQTEMAFGFHFVEPRASSAKGKKGAASKAQPTASMAKATPPDHSFILDKSETTITRAWATAVKKDADLGLLRDKLQEAGSEGLPLKHIRDAVLPHLDASRGAQLVELAVNASRPLAFLAGYDVPRLVHANFVSAWSVRAVSPPSASKGKGSKPPSKSNPTTKHVMPRAWLDIYGQPNEEMWQSAVKVVVGWARNRPGTLLSHLVNTLSLALDRLDVIDVVSAACDAGLIKRFFSGAINEISERQTRVWIAEDDEVGIEVA